MGEEKEEKDEKEDKEERDEHVGKISKSIVHRWKKVKKSMLTALRSNFSAGGVHRVPFQDSRAMVTNDEADGEAEKMGEAEDDDEEEHEGTDEEAAEDRE